jgi:hypothetical protein
MHSDSPMGHGGQAPDGKVLVAMVSAPPPGCCTLSWELAQPTSSCSHPPLLQARRDARRVLTGGVLPNFWERI